MWVSWSLNLEGFTMFHWCHLVLLSMIRWFYFIMDFISITISIEHWIYLNPFDRLQNACIQHLARPCQALLSAQNPEAFLHLWALCTPHFATSSCLPFVSSSSTKHLNSVMSEGRSEIVWWYCMVEVSCCHIVMVPVCTECTVVRSS